MKDDWDDEEEQNVTSCLNRVRSIHYIPCCIHWSSRARLAKEPLRIMKMSEG